MNAPTRLAAFAVVLVLAFAGAALAGAAIGPTDEAGPAADGADAHRVAGADGHGRSQAGHRDARSAHGEEAAPSGLAVSDGGFSFEPERTFFSAGKRAPFAFRITDRRGQVARDGFELQHDRELHLIVVRRDTAVFEHVHPRRREDGTWSVDLNLPEPGVYRAYADFKLGGRQRTLAAELFVPGDFQPERLPPPRSTSRSGDLAVEVAAPALRAQRATQLTFAVTRNGAPFDALAPYLGARGHLVALREGDLAYLHVHPTEGGEEHRDGDGSASGKEHGNEVGFAATFPTSGRYRLFLQFKTGGGVRTVAYTVEVGL